MNPEERAAVIGRAADALRQDQCVVLPTDTLYGLVTRANAAGADALDKVTGHPETTDQPNDQPKMTLHLADVDVILEHLVFEAATVRRLVDRLLPGPARLVIEQPDSAINALCDALNIQRGLIDNGSHIALRVPDHPIFRQVLRSAEVACVARRLGAAVWAAGENPGTDLSPIPDQFADDGVPRPTLVIDDGPTLHQQNSTTVRLGRDGKIEVGTDGVLVERDILAHLERTILFVCTGNTCRSPMAQAIAQHQLDQQEPEGITTRVISAGVAAGEGMPATDEAVQVLKGMGIEFKNHQSRLLTLPMIDQAEVIYTMTPSHAQAIMTMAPNSVHKVFVLDEHEAVPDPIGQGIDIYQHTADRLDELIARRLEEIRI